MKNGSPYLRVYAQACRGLSRVVTGQLDEAVKDLVDAVGFARRRRAGLENEARILADLANVHRVKGEFAAATVMAREAITIATARHLRLAECLARAVHAEALHASEGISSEVEGDLRRAKALVQETGAIIYYGLVEHVSSKLS